MTDEHAARPSAPMADADVANGESGVLDEGFEEQQGQRPTHTDADGDGADGDDADGDDADGDDADDAQDPHDTDDS